MKDKKAFFSFPTELVTSGAWANLSFKAAKMYVTLGCMIRGEKKDGQDGSIKNQSWIYNFVLSRYSGIHEVKLAVDELIEMDLIKTWWHREPNWSKPRKYYSLIHYPSGNFFKVDKRIVVPPKQEDKENSHELEKTWAKLSFAASKAYIALGCLMNTENIFRDKNQRPFNAKELRDFSGISVNATTQALNELKEENLINIWWHKEKIKGQNKRVRYYTINLRWIHKNTELQDTQFTKIRDYKIPNSQKNGTTRYQNHKKTELQDTQFTKKRIETEAIHKNTELQDKSIDKINLVSVCDSLVEKYFSAIGQSHAPENIRKNTHTVIVSLLEEGYSADQIEFAIDYAVMTKGKENIYSPNFLQWVIGEALSNREDVEQKVEVEEQQAERQAEIEKLESEKKKIEERIEEIWAEVEKYRETLSSEKIAECREKVNSEIPKGTMITETYIDMLINRHLMKEIGLEEEYNKLREEVKEYENQLL